MYLVRVEFYDPASSLVAYPLVVEKLHRSWLRVIPIADTVSPIITPNNVDPCLGVRSGSLGDPCFSSSQFL